MTGRPRSLRHRSTMAGWLVAVLTLGGATALAAQPYKRPKLDKNADPNAWESYYDHGVSLIQTRPNAALAAFDWARRLDPGRAEPRFASYVAYWLANLNQFEFYLDDREEMLKREGAAAAEASREQAFFRNPLTNQGLFIVIFTQMYGAGSPDPIFQGWVHLAEANFSAAAEKLGAAVAKNPAERNWLRQVRAAAWIGAQQPDSAVAELNAMLAQLRRADATGAPSVYESKELVEYAIGLIEGARGRTAAGEAAFDRALGENLAYWPAHWGKAVLRRTRQDLAGAADQLRQAVEIEENDGWLRAEYAQALLATGDVTGAAREAEHAVRLEPFYGRGYLMLAEAAERAADTTKAVAAWQLFLEKGPRGPDHNRAATRLAALRRP